MIWVLSLYRDVISIKNFKTVKNGRPITILVLGHEGYSKRRLVNISAKA